MSSLLVIGLDATDVGRLERLMGEGRVPHLEALRKGAAHGLLESRPDAFVNMVWPTLVTGMQAGDHGWHSAKMWRAERMRPEFGDPRWLPLRPFWSALEGGARIALLDIPFAPPPSERFEGISLSGWQTHDEALARSFPAGLRRRPSGRTLSLGPFPDRCRLADRRAAPGAGGCPGRDPRCPGRGHRTGAGSRPRALFACAAVRRPRHGTERRLAAHAGCHAGAHRGKGVVQRRRGRAPLQAEETASLEPRAGGDHPPAGGVNRALVPLWSQRMHDWSRTRAFTVPFDVHGFIRVNLRGRERDGIVDPAGEYEDLLDHIREGIESFLDIAGGRPASAGVVCSRELFAGGARTDLLPDLVVQIGEPLRGSPGLVSRRFGEIRFSTPDRFPSGRSGNHHPRGWYLLSGTGAGGRRDGEVVDLAPTILGLLGTPLEEGLAGRSLLPGKKAATPAQSLE